MTSPYQTVLLPSVILTGTTRVVVIGGMEPVVIRVNIVLAGTVQIISLQSGGENQEVHKCGGTTESVVMTTPYQTVHLPSVILTGTTRVVMIGGMETVVIRVNIVLAGTVQIISLQSGGENQEVHKCGGMTESVVMTTPYQTVHLPSVILTGTTRVVVIGGMETVVI